MITRIFFTYLFIIFFFKSNYLYSSIKESILISVDNKIITSYDLKNQIKTIIILSNKEINNSNIAKTKNTAISNLINLTIKELEVEKFNIQIDDDNIQNYLNRVSNGNINNFKNIFLKNDINFERYLENVETELKWQKLVVSKFKNKIKINEKEIENLLSQSIAKEKSLNNYNLSKIEIIFKTENDLVKEIEGIKKQINNFGFEQTALNLKISKSQVENLDIGWINEKALSKKIYDAIKNLKKGEISSPVIIANSVLFLKVNDFKKSSLENLNFDELKKNVINQKTNQLLNAYSKNHLSKLKNNALINYK